MYKLSIILAAYNVEDYIEDALTSFCLQQKNWCQLIVVNDGSLDSTEEIVEKYILDYPNIILLNKCNGGLSSARNHGLDFCLSDSQYVSFLDGDDILTKDYLDVFEKTILKSDCDIIEFNLQRFNSLGIKSIVNVSNFKGETILDLNKLLIVFSNYKWHSCGRFYKRNVFLDLRFDIGRRYEDMLLTPLLYKRAMKVYSIDKALYLYRMNDSSITTKGRVSDIEDVLFGYHRILGRYNNNKITNILYKKVIVHSFSIILNLSDIGDFNDALVLISSAIKINKNVLYVLFFLYKYSFKFKRWLVNK